MAPGESPKDALPHSSWIVDCGHLAADWGLERVEHGSKSLQQGLANSVEQGHDVFQYVARTCGARKDFRRVGQTCGARVRFLVRPRSRHDTTCQQRIPWMDTQAEV